MNALSADHSRIGLKVNLFDQAPSSVGLADINCEPAILFCWHAFTNSDSEIKATLFCRLVGNADTFDLSYLIGLSAAQCAQNIGNRK